MTHKLSTSSPFYNQASQHSPGADDAELERYAQRRETRAQKQEEYRKYHHGTPSEQREAKQKIYNELKESKDQYEQRKRQNIAEKRTPFHEVQPFEKNVQRQAAIAQQRKETAQQLREDNRRLAEERAARKQAEKMADAKYVQSSEQFMSSFGKSLY
ncbi:hypothetical protein BLNAU_12589 [Blattamonas nauphoetae]|uniref:Uncharacterized protein n=1 Tax=Blattamonas nauphoetae TaxID=2049346 RepID=A0ABQ9XJ73_9EUKA|nr:hypothetical protein BLNAU_12589 [Blattamonas nauphoetae]